MKHGSFPLLVLFVQMSLALSCSNPSSPAPGEGPGPVKPPPVAPGKASLTIRSSWPRQIVFRIAPYASTGTPSPDIEKAVEPNTSETITIEAGKKYCAWFVADTTEYFIEKNKVRVELVAPKDASQVVVIFPWTIISSTFPFFDYGEIVAGVDRCFPPILTPGAGAYDSPQSVTAANSGINENFYYTLDGADPDPATGLFVTGTIEIEGDHDLRVVSAPSPLFGKTVILGVSSVVTAHYGTPDHTPPAKVSNLRVTDNSSGHAVTLAWNDPADKDYAGVSIGYEGGSATQDFLKGVNTATFSGLKDSTAYTFDVVAFDSSGNKGSTAKQALTTPDRTPPTLDIQTIEGDYSNSSTLSFNLVPSEAVVGIAQSDISLAGATISYYAPSGNNVYFTMSPTSARTATTTISWTIPANSFADSAGNGNAEIKWSTEHYNAGLSSIVGTCSSPNPGFGYAVDNSTKRLYLYDATKRIVTDEYVLTLAPTSIKRIGSILYITSSASSKISRFDTATKSFLPDFTAPAGRLVRKILPDEPRGRMLLLAYYPPALMESGSQSYAIFVNISDGVPVSGAAESTISGTEGQLAPNGSFAIFAVRNASPTTLYRYAISGNNIGAGPASATTAMSYGVTQAISPDGSSLCAVDGHAFVWVYGTDTAMSLKINLPDVQGDSAVYSPDGLSILIPCFGNAANGGKLLYIDSSSFAIQRSIVMATDKNGALYYGCLTSDGKNYFVFNNTLKVFIGSQP